MKFKLLSTKAPLLVFLLIFSFQPFITSAQQVQIKGKITEASGAAIGGASVMVKGTGTGTTTDAKGNYQITAPSNGILVFTSVSYLEHEEVIGGRTIIDVTLKSGNNSLSDIVVVGYGSQKKTDVTGAVARVNLEAMGNAPNTNIGQYLQGTVPGLNVGVTNVAGGTPSIQIRGQVTLGGSQNVLIILDGVQYNGSLSSINPDDIGSIDVLKDASSTAVYGAQGANGVILITSKKGRTGKPRVAFSTAYTTQNPTQDFHTWDRAGFLEQLKDAHWKEAFLAPDYTQPNPAFNVIQKVDASMANTNRTDLNPYDFNWWKAGTGPGHIWENNLSLSGGNENFNYLLSGSMADQKNFIKADIFKRHTLRANLEIKPFKFWKVGLVSSGSFVNQDGAEPDLVWLTRGAPLVVPFDSTGKLIPNPTNTVSPNPLMSHLVDDRERHQYFFANIYSDLDIPFIKGLNCRINFGQNFRTDQHYYANQYGAGLTGLAYKDNQDYYDYMLDNIVNYSKSFGRHDITLTGVYGAIERKYSSTYAEGKGFARLNLSYNDIGSASILSINTDAWSEALNYQMGRLNYKYDDKYLLTATLRRDGFTGFAENFKYAAFPSVALGWILSRENFMNNVGWVSNLKLRLSYGSIGNQVSRYQSLARVETNESYVFGDGGTTAFGQQVVSLANPNLKWERTTGINVGIDFALLNNRLTGSLEYYDNNTTDLLYAVNIPNITGFGSILTNLGKIHNTGFEAGLTYHFVNKKDFSWSATVNAWANKNEIKSLIGLDNDGDGKEDDLVASGLFIGRPIQTIYDYQAGPIYQVGETPLPGFYTGTLSVVDQNKDGQIDAATDRVIIGRREPAYRMSLYNTLTYKGFTLTFLLNSVQGGKNGYLGNNLRQYFRDDNQIRENEFTITDFWSPRNPDGKYPRNISGSGTRATPGMWESRSFVRLQDVSLSYNLPPSVLGKIKAQSVSLFVNAKNLATWTKWVGWDPETGQNLALGGRPVMRAFTFGVRINY
jgi:TonB-linked SusC/RagA family outer membrane protein